MAKTLTAKRVGPGPRTYQQVTVSDLSGGLDLRRSPTLLAPNRARVLMNHSLATPGELVVRAGYQAFSTNSLGSQRIQGGVRAYLASTQFLLIAWNGGIYKPTDGGILSTTPVYSTLSAANQIYFPYDRTLVAAFDGVNRPVKSTDGSSWTKMGIDQPTGQSSASSVSSGSMSASEFEFSFSYKDRGLAVESNVSTLVSTRTLGATGAMQIQVPNSTDPQVDAIVIYARNKTAGEAVLRRATSGAMSAGASSTFVLTSSNWSANDEAPVNHNVPEAYRFGVVWKNRWWAADGTVGNRLHFSELFQNQSWPTLFYIDIPFERGDEITALVPQGDTLLVFGQSKLYLILGQTSLDFEVRPSAGVQAGALGPRCVAAIENGIVHAAAEGVFIYDGAADQYLSFDIEPGWRDLVKNTPSTGLELIALVQHFPFKELRIAVPRLFPRAVNGEWVLDLNRTREAGEPAWTDTDRTIGGYILQDGDEPQAGGRGRLFSWPSSGGQLFEESTGTSANSSNMTAEYEGPHFPTGRTRARFIDHDGEYEPHAGAFTVEIVVDGQSQGQEAFTIGAGLAQYGSAVYGTAQYGGAGRRTYYGVLPLEAEGRTIWRKTSYTGQESFRQFTYSLGMLPEARPRRFSE
jgi:hypothetical protein